MVTENVDFFHDYMRFPYEDNGFSTVSGLLFNFFMFGKWLFVNMSLSFWENINDQLTLMSLTCVSLRDSIHSLVGCCQHDLWKLLLKNMHLSFFS